MSFRLLPPALDDLDELEDWVEENFGPDFVVKTHMHWWMTSVGL